MARKTKLNTNFLIILSIAVVTMGVGGFVFKRYVFKQRPEKFITAGDKFNAEGKFADAAGHYGFAISLNQQDVATRVKYAKASTELVSDNPEMIQKVRVALEQALEVDPTFMPALEGLLDYYVTLSQIEPRAEVFAKVRDTAQRIVKIEPNHKVAQAYLSIATIQGWLFGVETDPAKIDEQIAMLGRLMLSDPTNAELPFYLAQAQLHRGQDLYRQSLGKDADEMFAQAAGVFDKPLKEHGDVAAMHFRAAQIFVALSQADSKKKDEYLEKANEHQKKARALVQADDPQFVEMYLVAAEVAKQQKDVSGAEKIIRELLEKRPDEQAARLALAQAQFIGGDPAKRQEAIELLSKPVVVGKSMRGIKGVLMQNYRAQTIIQLAGLRMDAYVASKDEKVRETLLGEIKGNQKELAAAIGDEPESLKLKGKVEILENNPVDAIQTLSRAQNVLQQRGKKDYELNFVLAKAYIATNQTGQAEALLTQVLDQFSQAVEVRILLTQLLINKNSVSDALKHIDILERDLAGNPDVIRLRVAALRAQGKKDEIKQYFAKLPESSRQEKLIKAQAALSLEDINSAIVLLEAIRKGTPGDADTCSLLARIYATQKKIPQAKEVLAEAIKQNPENKSLTQLDKLIDGTKPEDLIIEASTDEFTKQMNLAALARSRNDNAEFRQRIEAAAKLKPQDPQLLEYQFQFALQDRKFDVAAGYIDPLAKANKDQANGLLFRFRLAMAKGDTSTALSVARELTSKLPEFAQSWLSLAQALHASGQYEQAMQKYVLALEKQNGNPEAMKGIIECYYRLNKPDDAKRYIAQARQIFPGDPYFRELEIAYNLDHGDAEKAVAPREEMRAKDPKQPNNWIALGTTYLRVAQAKAPTDKALADSYLEKARTTFQNGLQQWPDERLFYGYLADIAIMQSDVAGAERMILQLAARDAWKDKPEPSLMLAELYGRSNRLADVEKVLRDALVKSKNNVDLQCRLSAFLAQQGKYDDATALLNSANVDDPRVKRQRIDVQIKGSKFADAEKSVMELLATEPNDVQLLSMLVVVHMSTGKYDAAIERCNQILSIDGKNLNALMYRGLVELNQGKYDEAVTDLSAVRDQNPTNVEARLALADCYRRRNEPENAARELEASLKVIPMNKGVRMRLIELYGVTARWSDAERLLSEAKVNPALQKDADWWRAESKIWLSRGNPGKAVASAEQAMAMAPNDLGALQDLLEALLQAKNFRGILSVTDPLVQKKSDIWWIYRARGVAKRYLEEKSAALEEYQTAYGLARDQKNDDAVMVVIRSIASEIGAQRAIEMIGDRKEPRWLLIKASLYQSDEDYPNAVAMVNQAMAMSDKMTPQEQYSTLRVAGTVFLTVRPPQVDKAKGVYEKLLEKYPNDLEALNNLACLLAEQVDPPQPQEALKLSTRAFEAAEKQGRFEPMIIDTQGWLLVLNGRIPEGINTLRQVVDRKPFVDAHYHLGEAYLKNSQLVEAEKQLARASDMMSELAKNPNENIDLQMKKRIDEAMSRARDMLNKKNQAKAGA